jgi:hypothetical protein
VAKQVFQHSSIVRASLPDGTSLALRVICVQSDQRPKIFRNIDPDYFRVYSLGDTWAEVTEGSNFAGGTLEHVRYDWSEPNTVRIQVL